jgi:hypothetical protein
MHQPPRKKSVFNSKLPVSRIISVVKDRILFVTAVRFGATGVKMFVTVGKTDRTAEKMCGIAEKTAETVAGNTEKRGSTGSKAGHRAVLTGIGEHKNRIITKANQVIVQTGSKAGNGAVLTGIAGRKNRIITEANQVIVRTGGMATLSRGHIAIGADPKDMGIPDYNPKATT